MPTGRSIGADPVRVLHVCDKLGIRGATVHGITRLITWWFSRWDSSRCHVELVGLRGWDASADDLVEHGVPVRCLDKGKFEPTTLLELIRLVLREKFQILHVHGYGASSFGRLAGAIAGVPVIVHEHFVDPAMPIVQRLPDRVLANLSCRGLGVSNSVVEFMANERYIPRERLELLPNGAPLADFHPVNAAAADAARRALAIPPGVPVIGAIGRLDEQKGILYLLKAMPLLRERGLEPWLLLIGDGCQEQDLREEARALGIADRVVFAGFTRDTRAWQTLLDIQVFPSLWEGTPLTLFEAMAMARPIVATYVDGLGEVLEHDVTGLLIPPKDPAALADAFAALLAEPKRAMALARNAHEAGKAYDIQNAVDRMQEIYEQLVGRVAVPVRGREVEISTSEAVAGH
jgi:glycosyltransferase involved in cell wall biosynthesis